MIGISRTIAIDAATHHQQVPNPQRDSQAKAHKR